MQTTTQLDLPDVRRTYETGPNYECRAMVPRVATAGPPRCFVFFSSHGIYFPNTPEAFAESILRQNRFEWKKNVPATASKVIYVRDVQKQWYVEGISARLNTVERVQDMLRSETRGFDVICAGSSAGGYAAVLFGCLLGARHVISLSGQFVLDSVIREDPGHNPLLVRHAETPAVNQYFSLAPLLERAPVPVFYLYPAGNPQDRDQAAVVRECKQVFTVAVDYARHDIPCYVINCVDLFDSDTANLQRLCRRLTRKPVSRLRLSWLISGLRKTLAFTAAELYGQRWRVRAALSRGRVRRPATLARTGSPPRRQDPLAAGLERKP